MNKTKKLIFTQTETAYLLRKHPITVNRMTKKGLFTAVMISNRPHYRREEIEKIVGPIPDSL